MSSFEIEIGVAGDNGGDPVRLSALVDTGAAHSMLPASLLARLGVKPTRQRTFTVADGRAVNYDLGRAMFFIGTEMATCPVIFGPEGRYLLGATTLGSLDLAVDPVNRRLMPVQTLYL